MSRARRLSTVLVAVVLFGAGCGGDDEATTTTAAPTTTVSTTTTTTSTTIVPQEDIVVGKGDVGPLVRSLQFLLLCNGYERTVVDGRDEDLSVDGVYGDVTGAFVALAQEDLGYRPDPAGAVPSVLLSLGASCDDIRTVFIPAESMSVRAEAYLDETVTDRVEIGAGAGQTITVTADQPMTLSVTAPSGAVLAAPATTTEVVVTAVESGDYLIESTAAAAGLYGYTIDIPPSAAAFVLQSTGLDFVDFGDPVDEVLEVLTIVLGEPTNDSGWTEAGGACVNHRLVTFGDGELIVDFTDSAVDKAGDGTYAAGGTEHFAAWESSLPDTDPSTPTLPALLTPSGLAVGDPADSVAEVYGDRVEVDTEAGTFSILDGIITGTIGPAEPADTGDGEEDGDDGDGPAVVTSMRSGSVLCETSD